MNPQMIIKILTDNYTLSEIEDRLDTKLDELEEGLYDYVVENYTEITQMFMEDLML